MAPNNNSDNKHKRIRAPSPTPIPTPTPTAMIPIKPPTKQMGLTSPISSAEPSIEDIQKTKELLATLQQQQVFETESELKQRVDVLAKLNALVKQWIFDLSIKKNMPISAAEKVGGKIYTFGSYRLGVHQKGADIDALCVAPRHVQRSDFFSTFSDLLKSQPEVTECRSIEEAFVPVIKMKFEGIEIDLLFARLALQEIPDDFDLSGDDVLKNLDTQSVRSLNGCRVTDEILALVPNVENFLLTLRAIKLWAKKQGVYSNTLGYFGGVTWAMLVARICQLYPNAVAATLVNKFFLVYSFWKWPNPVLLKPVDNLNKSFPVWDPRIHLSDRYHLMPVITPAYPQQNSTFNVTESTKKIIVKELERGKSLTDEIILGLAKWDRLFKSPSFFFSYKHFVVLLVRSQTPEDHLEWCGLVESRIRILIANLERHQNVADVHVNSKCFQSRNEENCSMWFVGLRFDCSVHSRVDLTASIQNFTEHAIKHGMYTKMLKQGMDIDVCHVRRKDLWQYLGADFLKVERKSNQSLSTTNKVIAEKRKRIETEIQKVPSKICRLSRESESSSSSSDVEVTAPIASSNLPTPPTSPQLGVGESAPKDTTGNVREDHTQAEN